MPRPVVIPGEQRSPMVLDPQVQQFHLLNLQTKYRKRLWIGRLFVGQC